ncbi:MAG TPA: urease accessory protein UreD [Dehalococcoidia bacterium]|nr:urease accessory protein UreD [Dehalococcoidia bacterium]
MARLATLRGALDARFSPGINGGLRVEATERAPLELRGPFGGGALPGYYLRNTTAGILDGDCLDVVVTVESGAAVQVSATSATKVYAGASSLDVRLRVEPGALLVWGPQTTILHAASAHRQTTRLEVGWRAVIAEVLVMGRLARGERYQFERFDNRLEVRRPESCEPAYRESYSLTPGPDLAASMGGRGVLASLHAVGFESSMVSKRIEAILDGEGAEAGWSELPNDTGVVVRALSDSLSRAQGLLERLVEELGGYAGL